MAQSAQPIATMRNLPNRSPIGPMTSWIEPWVSAYAVTMIEAAPTVTPISAAICGSSESDARTFAWLENPASASSAIARVGVCGAAAEDNGLSLSGKGGPL